MSRVKGLGHFEFKIYWSRNKKKDGTIVDIVVLFERNLLERIPKKKEMSIRKALKDIKREEAERGHGTFERPPVPFIPEKSQFDDGDRKELVLLVNPNATSSVDKKSTVKKSFYVLSAGTVEDYLLWVNNLHYVVKNKPCASAEAKFDMAKCLLDKDALDEWKAAEVVTTKDAKDAAGNEIGMTDATFVETTKLFLDQRVPAGAARKQKSYMRSHLKKPKSVEVKVTARRLREMNSEIPLMGGADCRKLSDHELMDILTKMCPQSWRIKFMEHNSGSKDEPDLEAAVKFFDMQEHTSALVQSAKKSGDKRPRNEADGASRKKGKVEKKKKFCQNCKDAGRPEYVYTNHNTRECKRKGDGEKHRNGDGDRRVAWKRANDVKKEKMFALFEKFQRDEKKKKP